MDLKRIADEAKNGAGKHTDSFMDKNTDYFKDILEPYNVSDLFELQDKLEKTV